MSHNADAAAVFWAEFQSSRRDIEALINVGSSSTNFDAIRDRITQLQGTLTASAIFLPAYDQQQCSKHIKDLIDSLETKRTQCAPRKKFAFKSRTTPASAPITQKHEPVKLVSNVSAFVPSYHAQDMKNTYIRFKEKESAFNDCALTNLSDCVVDLRNIASLASMQIRNLTNCLVVTSVLDGSIMMHDCTNCVFLFICRQFRFHTSSHCHIYLSVKSNPIIEHCNAIQFAPYPSELHHVTENDLWKQVDDFNWLHEGEQSPNWSFLPEPRVEWSTTLAALTESLDGLPTVLPQ